MRALSSEVSSQFAWPCLEQKEAGLAELPFLLLGNFWRAWAATAPGNPATGGWRGKNSFKPKKPEGQKTYLYDCNIVLFQFKIVKVKNNLTLNQHQGEETCAPSLQEKGTQVFPHIVLSPCTTSHSKHLPWETILH